MPANVRAPGLIPGLGRSRGGGNGNPLQYSCLGSPMDGGAWWATVHGVAASDTTEQRTLHFTCPFPGILRSATRHPPLSAAVLSGLEPVPPGQRSTPVPVNGTHKPLPSLPTVLTPCPPTPSLLSFSKALRVAFHPGVCLDAFFTARSSLPTLSYWEIPAHAL